MDRKNIDAEIDRVRAALEKTNSASLKRDYGVYLERLERKRRLLGRK